MNVTFMNGELRQFLDDCAGLASRKNRDYHPDDVAFLEFLKTACDTGVRVEQDVWGKITKQLSALRKYVIDGNLESEPPRGRMTDIANYMAILAFWDRHKVSIVRDAITFAETMICDCDFPIPAQPCDTCRFLLWLRDLHQRLLSHNLD